MSFSLVISSLKPCCRTIKMSHSSHGRRSCFGAAPSQAVDNGMRLVSTSSRRSCHQILTKQRSTIAVDTSLLQGTNSLSQGNILRHGSGDGCITLSVGGTKFITLRSTINECPVLADHVVRAERNKEILQDGAVFIDRDPKHFMLILQHLRNRADGIGSSNTTDSLRKRIGSAKTALVLPKDNTILQELYAEATYYRLDDLADTLCSTSFWVQAVGIFVRSNPFSEATKLFARLRAALLTFGTVGTVTVGVKQDIDWLLRPIGLQKRENIEPA